ncbi:hypothetical protein [Leptothermofonsia sp. ETS-13]|uniref:hypothetical protein n=1 Tax=Leptothermofonsia sp. ETS-13 TaxID=3035696 RepID=UPI003BA11B93
MGQLQQKTPKWVEDLKQQAQKQAKTMRKVTAIAAWWLFGMVFTSLAAAAIAGALAATN